MSDHPILFFADDDEDDIILFKEIAESLDAKVEVFLMGESMLDAMFNPPPQPTMVFIDLNMPIRSGFEIIKEIKAIPFFNDIPVIVLSTAFDQRTINKARYVGADYYIVKPSNSEGLRRSLQHVLALDWKTFTTTAANFCYRETNLI